MNTSSCLVRRPAVSSTAAAFAAAPADAPPQVAASEISTRNPEKVRYLRSLAAVAVLSSLMSAYAQSPHSTTAAAARAESDRQRSLEAEARGLAEPFRGVTRDGTILPRLFEAGSTGVSTEPIRKAAASFLDSLDPAQRVKTSFSVDDLEWRKWMNPHFYVRQGVSLGELTAEQRGAAIGLLRASLSAKGLKQSEDIMRLNHTLGELTGRFDEYGEAYYYLTVMGQPSSDEPWGWQLDGHHLVVNFFVLRDQVVMTPTFVGSEPVSASSGKHRGVTVLQPEQDRGLAMIQSLDAGQRQAAIIGSNKAGANNLAEAFKDNLVLDYAGVRAPRLTTAQQTRLLDLISVHVGNMRDRHAEVKMAEVRRHLDDTYFAWIGGTEADSLFYYRIHSPVIMIEFDHQAPIALPNAEKGKPTRQHIHTVVRTPNGNDYGKDLLRQHYERHAHSVRR